MSVFRIFAMLILGAALLSCSWIPYMEEGERNTFTPEILWELENDLGITNHKESLFWDGFLYVPEYGFGIIDLARKSLVSMNREIDTFTTNPAVWNDYVFCAGDMKYSYGLGNLYIYDRTSGNLLGRYWFADAVNNDRLKIIGEWLEVYKGYLYFALYSSYYEDKQIKIFRINLNSLSIPSVGSIPIIEPELFFTDTRALTFPRPIFEDDKIYLLSGGIGSLIPEDEPIMNGGYYHQSDVRLRCLDLSGNILWETGFANTGYAPNSNDLILHGDDQLLLATWDGLALIDKATGALIYEKEGQWADDYVITEGDFGYCTAGQTLSCFRVSTGKLIWSDNTNYSRDFKPVVHNNHLYIVDSDALRMYDKRNGRLLGVNYNLGVPGYRMQGYMPHKNGVLYIMQTEKIIAIRMK